MPELRSASVTKPYPLPDETARLFHVALHDAVSSSLESMLELRTCVRACVCGLRDTNVGPAQMIITMKACARESAKRYPPPSEHAVSNADFLMEQIIKWAIIEYYHDA